MSMPTYTFKNAAGETTAKRLTFQEFAEVRAGTRVVADDAGQPLELVFDPGSVRFLLKDGESGGWASKALKERRLRAERGEVMKKREQDHVFKTHLIPNYNGQEASSWREVQAEVRSDKGDEAASTYSELVKKESK
jgi:hypothetical protein